MPEIGSQPLTKMPMGGILGGMQTKEETMTTVTSDLYADGSFGMRAAKNGGVMRIWFCGRTIRPTATGPHDNAPTDRGQWFLFTEDPRTGEKVEFQIKAVETEILISPRPCVHRTRADAQRHRRGDKD